jgi:Urocanase Rossmann-like domain
LRFHPTRISSASLAEALRILKNEIRKGQAVSVAVAADQRRVVEEMLDRGVQPDLLSERTWAEVEPELAPADWQRFLDQGASTVVASVAEESPMISWTVNSQHARWLPRLDLCAQSSLPPDDRERHRWLRLAPRYLGRLTQRVHAVSMSPLELERFRDMAAVLVREKAGKDSTLWACTEPVVVTIQPFAEL